CAVVPAHAVGRHALALPQVQQQVAEGIAAQQGAVAGSRALPGSGDGAVGRVAAEAAQILVAVRPARLVELHHGLAEAEDVEFHGPASLLHPYLTRGAGPGKATD